MKEGLYTKKRTKKNDQLKQRRKQSRRTEVVAGRGIGEETAKQRKVANQTNANSTISQLAGPCNSEISRRFGERVED
jgi:hypothetical protein